MAMDDDEKEALAEVLASAIKKANLHLPHECEQGKSILQMSGDLSMIRTRQDDVRLRLASYDEKVPQIRKELDDIKKMVYEQHEPVVTWTRNFIDTYRKTLTAVVISGIITLIGFMFKVYDLLQKSNAAHTLPK